MSELFVNFTNRAALSAESGIVAILRNALTEDDVWISPVSPEEAEASGIGWLKSDIVRAQIGIFPFHSPSRPDHYDQVALGLLWPLMHQLDDRVHDALENMRFNKGDKSSAPLHANQLSALAVRAANYDRHIAYANKVYREYDADNRISLVHDFTCAGIQSGTARANVYTVHTPFPGVRWLSELKVGDIPFVETEFFKDFMLRMVSYDLVTMHTDRDVGNFLSVLQRIAPDFKADGYGRFTAFGRSSCVKKVHVGIDPGFIQKEAEGAVFSPAVNQNFIDKIKGRKAVLSVARHDYTKGTLEYADTIDAFFSKYPERIQDTAFVVIRQPSRAGLSGQVEYQESANKRFQELKAKYGDAIVYENTGMRHAELMRFMQLPEVVAITALPTIHEGHDLTVREFVDVNPRGSLKAVLATEGVGALSVLAVRNSHGQECGAFKVSDCKNTSNIVAALDLILSGQHDHMLRQRFAHMKAQSNLYTGRRYLDEIVSTVDKLSHDAGLHGSTHSGASPSYRTLEK